LPSSWGYHDFCIAFGAKIPSNQHNTPAPALVYPRLSLHMPDPAPPALPLRAVTIFAIASQAKIPAPLIPTPAPAPPPPTPSALSANLLEVQISRHRPPDPSILTDGNELHFNMPFGLRPNRVASPCYRLSTTLSSLPRIHPFINEGEFCRPIPLFLKRS